MPISSVSTRIYDAPDPVMETDLELLAKVNTWQEDRFEAGAQELQNEIDNWALLADVAKPQDRKYINAKLNNIVGRVTEIGGVNVADSNNVNALKSLGYNLYGDERVMNAAITTKKMRMLGTDINTKMSGKNAKDYDPVYGSYLLNKYNSWLNDNQVGSAFDGPTELPQGNFNAYLKKVEDTVNKLVPDANDVPQGNLDKSLGYFQIGNKYLSRDRVLNAINAVTDANDLELIKAHGWNQMRGYSNTDLAAMQDKYYDNKINDLQKVYNDVMAKKSLAPPIAEQNELAVQAETVNKSIKEAQKQRVSFYANTDGKVLSEDARDGITTNLFFDAFTSQYAGAKAYSQQKTEYKFNQPLAFLTKENREGYQFEQTKNLQWMQYGLDLQKLGIEEQKLDLEKLKIAVESGNPQLMQQLGLKGPASFSPMSIMPVDPKDPASSAQFTAEGIHQDAQAHYDSALQNYYTKGYNYLATNVKDDAVHNLLKQNEDGTWGAKDAVSAKTLNNILDSKVQELSKLADTPMSQRSPNAIFNADDQELFAALQNLKQAGVYKEQTKSLEDQAFKNAYGDNDAVLPQNKYVSFQVAPHRIIKYDYRTFKTMLDNAKANPNGEDAKKLKEIEQQTKDIKVAKKHVNFVNNSIGENFQDMWDSFKGLVKGEEVSPAFANATLEVGNYYAGSKEGWTKVSQTYNPYGRFVSLPKNKEGKVLGDWDKFFESKLKDQGITNVNQSDVDLVRVWETFDASKDNKVRYKAEVKYRKASNAVKGNQTDLTAIVDVTDDVLKNQALAAYYPQSNSAVVYGSILDQKGITPDGDMSLQTTGQVDGKGGYAQGTHKYRVVTVYEPGPSGSKQIKGFKVKIHIPGHGDVFLKNKELPAMGEYFPADLNAVINTVEYQFSSPELVNEFYKENNIK